MQPRCKICGSANLSLKHDRIRDGADLIDCNVFECSECGIIFLDLEANQKELLEYYRGSGFRNNYLPDIKDKDSKEAEKFYTLKQLLQEKRFKILERLFKKNMEVLDVGCATAGFLGILKNRVKRVKGLELYMPHVEFARKNLGIDVQQASIEDISGETFDVICTFHVLEHVVDPVEFLKEFYVRIKKGGYIIIEVPNCDDALISIFDARGYKNFYFMKPHLFYFNEKSMKNLLEKADFCDVRFKSYQHYGLINHLHWALVGQTCSTTKAGGAGVEFPIQFMDNPHLEEIMPFFEEANAKYKKFLEDIRKTDTLLVVARR